MGVGGVCKEHVERVAEHADPATAQLRVEREQRAGDGGEVARERTLERGA